MKNRGVSSPKRQHWLMSEIPTGCSPNGLLPQCVGAAAAVLQITADVLHHKISPALGPGPDIEVPSKKEWDIVVSRVPSGHTQWVAAMQAIAHWLNAFGLGQNAERFADIDIDADILRDLTDEDLKQIGASLGHRKRLLRAIAALDALDEAALPAEPPWRDEAERRQLNAMFCDLVGSTAFSTKLDPKDLQAIIGAYHRQAMRVARGVRRPKDLRGLCSRPRVSAKGGHGGAADGRNVRPFRRQLRASGNAALLRADGTAPASGRKGVGAGLLSPRPPHGRGILWTLGDLLGARDHLDRAMNLYNPARDSQAALRFAHDHRASALVLLALDLWCLGHPQAVLQANETAIEEARAIGHIPTLVALCLGALLNTTLRRDLPRAERQLAEALLQEYGFRIGSCTKIA
jgi:hypothetical protein